MEQVYFYLKRGIFLLTCIIFCAYSSNPRAQVPVIVNGGFVTGFAGWTRADQIGSDGTFVLQSGTLSPLTGDIVPAPPQGTAAMTDAGGPGSHVLFQDFVASGSNGLLRFDLFLGNRSNRYATPSTLDFSTPALNQQARVDILRASAAPFSVATADILMTLYRSQVGDPLVNGYFTVTSDIGTLLASHTGEMLRLRFAETDNVGPFQFGVDNVRIEEVTPVVFYSKSLGDLHNVLTWGSNPDGSGVNPTDFGVGKTFNLANRVTNYTLTGDWTVAGLIVNPAGGQLQINGFTLSEAGISGAGTIAGSPTSNLIVTGNAGHTLNFTLGSVSSRTLNNLTLKRAAAGAVVALGFGLPVNILNVLSVDMGTLNTNSALTLKSTAANTARVAPIDASGIVSGNVTVERYIPARRAWRIMSAPVGGSQTINAAWQEGVTTSSPNPNPNPGYGTHITEGSAVNGFDHNPLTALASVKKYLSASNTWVSLPNTNATPVNNDAYLLFVRGDRGIPLGYNNVAPNNTTLRATGPLKVGDQSFPVSASGFTAIPNPFASPINFATLTRTNVQNNFYVWDPKIGAVGAYILLSFNGVGYDVIPAAVSPISQYIQSGQGFLVHSTGSAGSIVIKESDKANTPSTNVFRPANGSGGGRTTATLFEDPSKGQGLRLQLKIVNEDRTMAVLDEVFASYKTAYSDKVDQLDAVKADNIRENLAIVSKGQTLMIERKPIPEENEVIALKLWNTEQKSYVLELNPVNLSATDLVAIVEDKYLKTFTTSSLDRKSQVPFFITSNSASARADRFQIKLTRKVPDALTSLPGKAMISAFPNPFNGKTINLSFVNKPQGAYQVTLVNSIGQLVFVKNIQHAGGTAIQDLQINKKLAKGLYQLKITGKDGSSNLLISSN